MNGTDLTLLKSWKERRDADSFGEIVSRHSAMVFGTCCRIVGDTTEAEDITQECFLRLVEAEDSDIERSLRSWLHTLATRLSINQLRSKQRRKRRESAYAKQLNTHTEPSWNEVKSHVDRAISELPQKLQYPIISHFLEGQTYEAIAASLGIPRSTVANRAQKGISAIRKSLKRRGVGVAVAGLTAFLASQTAQAIPASLAAELGKLALTGYQLSPPPLYAMAETASSAGSQMKVTGGIVLMTATKKNVLVGALLSVALIFLLTYMFDDWFRESPATDHPGAEGMSAVAHEESNAASPPEKPPAPPPNTSPAPAMKQNPEEGEPKLVLPASVSGSVFDKQAYGLEGATVYLEVCQDESRIQILATYSAVTDQDGAYAISGIDTFGHAAAFALGEGHCMGKKYVGQEIVPGLELSDVDFNLAKAAYFVAGQVVTEAMTPIPGARVQLRYFGYDEKGLQEVTSKTGATTGNISDSKFSFASTDENGNFEIAIRYEGLCDFTVTKPGYGTGFFPQVPTGSEDALFVLRARGAIAGRVTRPDGAPVKKARVRVSGHALPGGLVPSTVRIQSFRIPAVVVYTDSDGEYTAKGLGEDYVYAILAEDVTDDSRAEIALRDGVRVTAGQTTTDVDLVLIPPEETTVVFGTVTEAETGRPVHPLAVFACHAKAERPDREVLAACKTEADGSYGLEIDLKERAEVRVLWRYAHTGGYGPFRAEMAGTTLWLTPGAAEEVNITIENLPFTVPIRYVDKEGKPIQGVRAGIHLRSKAWGWQGTRLKSGADGRVTWHGLTPGETYEALGLGEAALMGRSKRFTGKSGETVTEVEVVCTYRRGGIEGKVVDTQGKPVADTDIRCSTLPDDATNFLQRDLDVRHTTDTDGTFCLTSGMAEGIQKKVFLRVEGNDQVAIGVIENVEIAAGEIRDVGTVILRPEAKEKVARMLQGRDSEQK